MKKPKPVYVHGVVVEQVRSLQERAARSQREFAAVLGISERTLRRWEEKGATFAGPSAILEKLEAEAKAANVSLRPKAAVLQALKNGRESRWTRTRRWR